MTTPTLFQQRAVAFAPKPFAAISFLSSAYVIHYLVCKERQRLTRLYHRLVLAMNIGLLFFSFTFLWGSFAVPAGTPNYAGAFGTVQTCTANGFLAATFQLNVPIYYASLSLQAFMGIRNNFEEKKYRWIEKWVHISAYVFPCAIATVFAVTQNFNPSGAGCYISKAPRGCEADPDVPCTRGEDIKSFELILGLSLIFIYFIFPPSVIASMYCWIKKVDRKIEASNGMRKVRESARKRLLQNVARQMSLYLFSFWFTWVFSLACGAYQTLSGGVIMYDFLTFAHCVNASQGFVFAVVYFTLERRGTPQIHSIPSVANSKIHPTLRSGRQRQLTVMDIRASAQRKSEVCSQESTESRRSFVFNIFDGVPDEDSPWAKFIHGDDDEDSDIEEPPDEGAQVQISLEKQSARRRSSCSPPSPPPPSN